MLLAATVYVDNGARTRAGGDRQAKRRAVRAGATLRDVSETPIDAEVVDLSTSGCLVALAADLTIPSMVTIGIAGIGRVNACVVRRDGNRYGCAFIEPLTGAAVAAARAVETVVLFGAAALPTPDPAVQEFADVERLPMRTRMLFITGSAFAAWGVVIAAILALRTLIS